MELEIEPAYVIIGYFPFRAKAQILRLLCQFLHIPYRDRFFTPDEWSKFKETEGKGWVLKDMPYLEHDGFITSGNWAPAHYLIDLSKRHELLGATQKDRIRIDEIKNKIDLKDAMISLIINNRSSGSCEEKKKCFGQFYQKRIQPPLLQYEQECSPDIFFFGYLTIFDFIIYEIINHISVIYNCGLHKLPKLVAIRNRVAEIPEIHAYENSSRAVTEVCPIQFFKKFKEEKLNACKGVTQSSQCPSDMQIQ